MCASRPGAQRLDALLELADIDEVILTRAGADNLVLVREPVWRGVQEALHLLGNDLNAERLLCSLQLRADLLPIRTHHDTGVDVSLAREDLAWWRRHDRRVARELLHLMRRLHDGACIPPARQVGLPCACRVFTRCACRASTGSSSNAWRVGW
jgi:PHD/YefM family antitoxin component YafN of YafNO toxin-antitoxin module